MERGERAPGFIVHLSVNQIFHVSLLAYKRLPVLINFQKHILSNGLRVIIHPDPSSELAVVNVLYDVGSRDEEETLTGFAHLFEHLMFGGSVNIPSYDEPLQNVGGENNAFTTPDITNYYCQLPAKNLETAFWLESDRMLSLAFSNESLEIQRKVVIEEFKQRYLNQPYGDAWLKLRPLCYKVHPYKWATIGKDISHIENASMNEVKSFFKKHYCPSNAILVIAGNVIPEKAMDLCKKWFEPIPAGIKPVRKISNEPIQVSKRTEVIKSDVPLDALYMTFHTVERLHPDYFAVDLLSDLLGRGEASQLYDQLVKKKQLFNTISAYTTGSTDRGLLVIEGRLNEDFSVQQGEEAVFNVLRNVINQPVPIKEFEKVKNKAESSLIFSDMSLLNIAAGLAYSECLGNADLFNKEAEQIQAVTLEQFMNCAKNILKEENVSVMYYLRN